MTGAGAATIRWLPAEEHPVPGEEELFERYIREEIRRLHQNVSAGAANDGAEEQGGPDWHHGVAAAPLEVRADAPERLPAELRVGAFAGPGAHPAVVRMSYGTGAAPRLAVKLRLHGDEARAINWLAVADVPCFATVGARELLRIRRSRALLLLPSNWPALVHLLRHRWDSIPEHRPLGELQRARRVFYAAYALARLRHLQGSADGRPAACPFPDVREP